MLLTLLGGFACHGRSSRHVGACKAFHSHYFHGCHRETCSCSVHLLTIPVRGALDFKVKDCPVCAVMKRNRPKKPTSLHVEEKRQWKLWEKVFSDSSGKTRVKSFQGNCYYSVFVCARSGRNLFFAHKKKSHYPLVYFKFCRYPKFLVTNQAGKILSKDMGSKLAAQGTRIDPCPKDEHSKNGSAEHAIGEFDRMIACGVLDGNLPPASWDLVGDDCSILNAITQSCPNNDSITIYEAEIGMIHDLDLILPLACYGFAAFLS